MIQSHRLYAFLRSLPIPKRIREIGRASVHAMKGGQITDGCIERLYFQLGKSKALESAWVASYLIYRKFLQTAERVPTLDLCCGPGAGTKLIAEALRVKAVGVDYCGEAVKYAENHNSNSFTEYHVLDLNKASDLHSLIGLIRSLGVRQVFFIEGIEHLLSPHVVINALLESPVERIFVSTPFEKEGTPVKGYHCSPFTPSVYHEFTARFGSRILCYCKFVDRNEVRALWRRGASEEEIIEMHFTASTDEALNYIIEIDRRAQLSAP